MQTICANSSFHVIYFCVVGCARVCDINCVVSRLSIREANEHSPALFRDNAAVPATRNHPAHRLATGNGNRRSAICFLFLSCSLISVALWQGVCVAAPLLNKRNVSFICLEINNYPLPSIGARFSGNNTQ